jgi:hypothetical protein
MRAEGGGAGDASPREGLIEVPLRAAVALIPFTPSLGFPTYFLTVIDGMIRQITSAVWKDAGEVAVIWYDADDAMHVVHLPAEQRVEIRQRWE